ncbi:hypothetical protein H0Z60_11280 [Ectothiorhodospiraceae bacterium WFHF3C12]|nr:hypothetical protein [Ectothiorhodospiraceae bacterium WFHF3C12]
MNEDDSRPHRGDMPDWLRAGWEEARGQSLPLCLMLIDPGHAAEAGGVRAALGDALPASAFGPFELDDGRVAAALPATSPEAAYRVAYRVHGALPGGCRMGLAMAAPRRPENACALLRHAQAALCRADREGLAVQGMDVILD